MTTDEPKSITAQALRAIAENVAQANPVPIDTDDEQFCERCFAGVDSDEHHTKCVVKGYAYDGETAWGRWKRYADRPSVWISNEI